MPLLEHNVTSVGAPFKRDIVKELADECHRQGMMSQV